MLFHMLLMFLFLPSKSTFRLYNSNVELVCFFLFLCMQDVLQHIHSLMPMQDAARAACASRSFLNSWICHPNLYFSKDTLGFNENACQKDESVRLFYSKVDHILERHSGIGIEELTLILVPFGAKYNFPRSVLLNGSGDSIQYLHLTNCSFRPTVTFGGLRSLTKLHLCLVRITGDELGLLLSHSLALEKLELVSCDRIVYLKIPPLLQRLNYLEVCSCAKLKVINNEAPNVSSFTFGGSSTVQLSLGETSQMKSLIMYCCGSVFFARAELPSSMPNLEALTVHSHTERAYAPMLCSKFLHLRRLSIALTGASFYPTYDYLSLASYFDAAPSLETFNLNNVSIFADPADLRQMRELQHHNLRIVSITGFSSAKSLIELTCHVLKSMISLECMTLEAPQSCVRCTDRDNKSGKCSPLERDILTEGHRAVMAIRRYIEPRVPFTVKLHVLEPCSCHAVDLYY
ncbi:hypothetical protein HU200_064497 [Digitaria exilis]|uniref:At1g61320/AtMIF1 LRR domain-containing protein n=1 Tax=Digitaria exilis TaxID=1010633 RepID=A0A835A421_9POAL|nr:hypothetical protein HU200_064497 [Digitaria exilis]